MRTPLGDWKDFKESTIWLDILDELSARDTIIVSKLREGNDSKWSDDNMRGRLSEIEYFKDIVDAIILDLSALNLKKEDTEHGKE